MAVAAAMRSGWARHTDANKVEHKTRNVSHIEVRELAKV